MHSALYSGAGEALLLFDAPELLTGRRDDKGPFTKGLHSLTCFKFQPPHLPDEAPFMKLIKSNTIPVPVLNGNDAHECHSWSDPHSSDSAKQKLPKAD